MVRWETPGYEEIGGERAGGGGEGRRVWRLVVTLLSLLVVLGLLAFTILSLTSHQDRVVLRMTSGGGWARLPPPHTPDPKWDPEPSPSELGRFDYAAVSVDSIPCSKIGK